MHGNGEHWVGVQQAAWPQGEYALWVEGHNLQKQFPGRAIPTDTMANGRMNQVRLEETQLDCLLIDGIDVDWIPWLGESDNLKDPRVILWMVDEMCIGNDRTGPMSSGWRKKMQQRGYTARFWYLNAHHMGAPLNQSRLAVVYFKGDQLCGEIGQKQLAEGELPSRAMDNLLLPVGVPRKAWNHEPDRDADCWMIKKYFPCLVEKCVGDNKPIFESCSPMPDLASSWIRSEK
jgi:hypothetical protein